MYLRLFRPYTTLRYLIYIGMSLNWAFFIAVASVNIYFNVLFESQVSKRSLVRRSGSSPYIVLVSPIGSLILDIYIFLLPIVPVWRLRLGVKERMRVIAVFATGLM